jgi:hypothetical protein
MFSYNILLDKQNITLPPPSLKLLIRKNLGGGGSILENWRLQPCALATGQKGGTAYVLRGFWDSGV